MPKWHGLWVGRCLVGSHVSICFIVRWMWFLILRSIQFSEDDNMGQQYVPQAGYFTVLYKFHQLLFRCVILILHIAVNKQPISQLEKWTENETPVRQCKSCAIDVTCEAQLGPDYRSTLQWNEIQERLTI